MLKKLKALWPAILDGLKLLPRAALIALAMLPVYWLLVRMYNPESDSRFSVYLTGWILGILGFYLSRGIAGGIRSWLEKYG